LIGKKDEGAKIFSYENLMQNMLMKSPPGYKVFRCVMPSWDNTPRKKQGMTIITGANPEKYENWLKKVVQETAEYSASEERIVFINAWNEWAEGCHLEPDQKFGLGYLEATRKSIEA